MLGVAASATPEEVKTAYRKKAMEHHPDRHPDNPRASDIFVRLNLAYEIIKNGVPADAAPGAQRGANVTITVEATLADALAGSTIRVRADPAAPCPTCAGAGKVTCEPRRDCQGCGGSGQVVMVKGLLRLRSKCKTCGGDGRARETCHSCGGNGRNPLGGDVGIKVPPGAEDGQVVVLPGKGAPGWGGGRAGDLVVHVKILPDARFRRRGADLLVEREVSFTDVVMGTKVQVPTLGGPDMSVEIPAGTQPGKLIVLDGLGMPEHGGGARGRLMVKVSVHVPSSPTREQRELLKKWKAAERR